MIAIPFAVMLAAVCLLMALSRGFRIVARQPAAPVRARGRHWRTADSTEHTTFGRSVFGGEWRQFRYYTLGGAS